ncbi:MAG: tetratricopeptide repeat protein [Syntrophaceticus sp.]
MAGFFKKQHTFARVGIWVLVGMIIVGLLGSTLAWYISSEPKELKPDTSSSKEEVVSTELEQQEALRKEYEGMLASKPNDLAVLTGYARVEMGLGELYLQEQKEDQARKAFQRAVTLYQKALEQEDDQQLRLELASAYQVLQEDSKAEDELQKILKQDPGNIQALAQMGLLLESREDWDGAIKVWESVASSPQADQMTKEFSQARIKELQQKK